MKSNMDYLLAQSLSLVFYIITLVIYSRARKEYVGGKIAAAINLIMAFMVILLLADAVDYFFSLFLPLGQDTIIILKILLKLIAIGVLFFGGLRFFVSRPAGSRRFHQPAPLKEIENEFEQSMAARPEQRAGSTVVLKDVPRSQPTLGRYEILEQIGRGAMGVVYKGRDPKLNRLIAIKTIRFTDEFDEDQVQKIKQQFYREANVVAKLAHPNIVTIYDVDEDLDLSYLAMEYLEGESLEKYTREGNLLPIKKCIDILLQVCDALEFAHSHGIVHRDVKPANIMLLKSGIVKVTDFGIARVSASSKTHTGIIKGTPDYMSPEQAKGLKVGGPSDLFSLGVVFYQLLTGRLPFSGENMAAIMYQITAADYEPPTTYNPGIDKATLIILNRSLEKSLDKRYQTAKQMGDDLRLLIQSMEAGEDLGAEEDLRPKAFDLDIETDEILDASVFEVEPGSEKDLEKDDDLDFSDLELLLKIDTEMAKETDAILEDIDRLPVNDATFDKEKTSDRITEEKPVAATWKRILLQKEERANALSRFSRLLAVSGFLVLALLGVYYYFSWQSTRLNDQLSQKLRRSYLESQKTPKSKKEKQPEQQIKIEQKQTEPERLANVEKEKQAATKQLESVAKEKAAAKEQLESVAKEKEAGKEQLERAPKEQQTGKEQPALIAKEKQAAKERLAEIAKEKQAAKERLALIAKDQQAAKEQLENVAKEKLAALKLAEIHKIDNFISDAKKYLKLKKYLEAKNSYDAALKVIDAVAFKTEDLFLKYENQIKEALKTDEIIHGSKGYIQYKNRWMSPDEYENKLYQEGYVKYKGKLKYYKELKDIIEQITSPGVRSFLISKYSGQNIHKKQVQFQKLVLGQNTRLSSHYTVFYRWEVWTFNEIGEGECSFDIHYDIEKDAWNITRGCE